MRRQTVDSDSQHANTSFKSIYHHGFFTIGTFAETESQVAHCLANALHLDGFVERKPVMLGALIQSAYKAYLCLHARVLNHGSRVCRQSRDRASEMRVNLQNLFDRTGIQ